MNISILPKAFQDAILVAQRLYIPYLWIDCLCIIQNDEHDWHQQAAEMTDVYRDAHLVVSADRCASDNDGFLEPRQPENVVTMHSSNKHINAMELKCYRNGQQELLGWSEGTFIEAPHPAADRVYLVNPIDGEDGYVYFVDNQSVVQQVAKQAWEKSVDGQFSIILGSVRYYTNIADVFSS